MPRISPPCPRGRRSFIPATTAAPSWAEVDRPLSLLHVGLTLLVVVIWGLGFVATRIALDSFSPPELMALRFLIAAGPVLFLPRPPLRLSTLVAIGLTLFAGQFLLQFFALTHGLSPGLASLLVQTQALFTILFAAIALRETPTARQLSGVAVAFAGLVLIVFTVGADLTVLGFALAIGSAISWGVGNVLLKRMADGPALGLVVWLSLVPPVPALAWSWIVDGPAALPRSVSSASWASLAAALYLGLVATILAYAIWSRLLRRYPAATVTPFALLVPFVGALGSALVFGERFGVLRVAGMALVLLGIAVIVLRWDRFWISRDDDVTEEPPALSMWPATRDDAPGVIDLIGRVYAEYNFVYDPRVEVPDLFRFEEHYEAPHGAFFVVREGDVIVGSVGVERLDGQTAELHRLYLDARLRGRGTGRALVLAALAWCRSEQGISRLILWSDTRFDQAHRLYTRMGFRRTGERTLPDDLNQTREYGFERPV